MPQSDNEMTVKEAVAALGFSPQWIRYLCRSGKLVARKPGRDWLVERQSVEEWAGRDERKDEGDG